MTKNGLSELTGRQLAAALRAHAPVGPHAEPHLHAIVAGTAAQPGKLLRGRLVLATAAAHELDEDAALFLATAVEYFQIASLLLDDLPCMDDAQVRRGQPCAHVVHGEASAILAALAFINRAYALAGVALIAQPASVRLQAQACLDACLGTSGLVGGQARDLRFAESDRSTREVSRVGLAKTGSLFWLGLLLPSLLMQPERAEARKLEALCLYWGLAFQALDDLQDVIATSVDAGKTTGRDRELTRPNLALALGVPATGRRITRLLAQAERTIQRLVALRAAWVYLADFQAYFAGIAASVRGAGQEIAA